MKKKPRKPRRQIDRDKKLLLSANRLALALGFLPETVPNQKASINMAKEKE